MKKPNFKTLALMGITGGVALCSSASASEIINIDNASHLLAANCGGKGGCGGNFTAYQPHGCNGQSQPNYAPQSQAYAPQGGCNTRQQTYQPQGSCSASQPQSYYNAAPAQGGCNASAPQGGCNGSQHAPQGMGQPQASRNISQWETNGKVATADTMTSKTSEEAQILSQLNDEGKSIYRGLDPAGKAMANQAISQSKGRTPEEKTQALKAIAQKLSEKRANANAPRS